MRSLLWTTVFLVLVMELFITLLLVIPFPRTIRSKICLAVSKLQLKKRLQTPLTVLFCALSLALVDTTNFLIQLHAQKEQQLLQEQEQPNNFTTPMDRHLRKEKEYKAARNLYLAAFALTLLFVIGRITELMQEHAELEGKIENLKLAASIQSESNRSKATVSEENDSAMEGIEMKSMSRKKEE